MTKNLVFILVILSFVSTLSAGCAPSSTPTAAMSPSIATAREKHSVGAFESNEYRNLFKEYLDKSDAEVQAKIDAAWIMEMTTLSVYTTPFDRRYI